MFFVVTESYGGGRPTRGAILTAADWAAYCEKFPGDHLAGFLCTHMVSARELRDAILAED